MNRSYQDLDQNDSMRVTPGTTNATSVEDIVDVDSNKETLHSDVGIPSDEPVYVTGTSNSYNQAHSREIDVQTENASSQKEMSGQVPIWPAFNALLTVAPDDAALNSSKGETGSFT